MRELSGTRDPANRTGPEGLSGITVRLFNRDTDLDGIQPYIRDRDIDADRDTILVAECGGRIAGIVALRLSPFAHGLEVRQSPVSRRVADALIHYGRGYARASGFGEVIFHVEQGNVKMAAFIEAMGAVKDEPADVYYLNA